MGNQRGAVGGIQQSLEGGEIVPNKQAKAMLKDIYMSGKNKGNKDAKWVDTTRGEDFIVKRLPLSDVKMDDPSNGVVDSTVDLDYAKTLIADAASLPPVLIGKNMKVIDGGHRVYAMKQAGMADIPVIMSKSNAESAKPASGRSGC